MILLLILITAGIGTELLVFFVTTVPRTALDVFPALFFVSPFGVVGL